MRGNADVLPSHVKHLRFSSSRLKQYWQQLYDHKWGQLTSLQTGAVHRAFVQQIWGWLVNAESDHADWVLPLRCETIYFHLRQTRRWTFNIMAIMHFDFLSLTAHVKRKHATPANIRTVLVWSSLNNWEYTSYLSLSVLQKCLTCTLIHIFFPLLFLFDQTSCNVRSNLFPALTYDSLVGKNYLQAWAYNQSINQLLNDV